MSLDATAPPERLPISDNNSCPRCYGPVAYGVLLDSITGQRGYCCERCEFAYSSMEVRSRPPAPGSKVP